ncbi:MAG: hypothetical protein OXU86_05735 [Thaumarchaeota archaeon]|nr:hypothetical protein [Nitrososphaerota archaeon]MDD9826252.1 hypothetical protein [Nitrososphaerota archaeon]
MIGRRRARLWRGREPEGADRLESLTGIDAFVQVVCPRISTDNPFRRPVLSVPQADALLRVMRGGEPGEFLRAPHWL